MRNRNIISLGSPNALKIMFVSLFLILSAKLQSQCNYNGTSTNGSFSSAIGTNTHANGNYSFVAGENSQANGRSSFSFGQSTSVFDNYALGIGRYLEVYGSSSLAIGRYLKTLSPESMVIGYGFSETQTLDNAVNRSLMIGFGSTKPTLFVERSVGVNNTGRIGIGNVTDPQAKLHIRADAEDDATLFLEATGTLKHSRLQFTNEHFIQARNGQNLTFTTQRETHFVFQNGSLRSVNGSAAAPAYSFSGSTTTGMFRPLANTIGFSIANTERVRIDPNGNVGIGTTDPNARVHVKDGDIFIEDIDHGIIMKSPNGQCWRGVLSDDGQLIFSSIDCPDGTVNVTKPAFEPALQLKIYPNPTEGTITILVPDDVTNADWMLSTINGKRLMRGKITSGKTEVSLAHFVAGVYVISIEQNGRIIKSEKVIKQ